MLWHYLSGDILPLFKYVKFIHALFNAKVSNVQARLLWDKLATSHYVGVLNISSYSNNFHNLKIQFVSCINSECKVLIKLKYDFIRVLYQ